LPNCKILRSLNNRLAEPQQQTAKKKTEADPFAQAIRASMKTVTDSQIDDLQRQLLADASYKWKLLQKNRSELLPLLLAAQEKRPDMTSLWCHLISMVCSSPDRPHKTLSEEEVDVLRENVTCLAAAMHAACTAIEKHPDLEDSGPTLNKLRYDLASSMLAVNGGLHTPRRLAEEMLRSKVDPNSWDYGNVVHRAHTILGRVALRGGDLEAARGHLLKSAKVTRGSPQLNSFGPSFTLASELLEKEQRGTVLEYLELVGTFWATELPNGSPSQTRLAREHRELLSEWKAQISAGNRPEHTKWGTQHR
jgi:hypothetical protein